MTVGPLEARYTVRFYMIIEAQSGLSLGANVWCLESLYLNTRRIHYNLTLPHSLNEDATMYAPAAD
jgi:hypothetical protein